MRPVWTLLCIAGLVSLGGCASSPSREDWGANGADSGRSKRLAVGYGSSGGGDFVGNPAVDRFIRDMQSRYGFDPGDLRLVMAKAERKDWIVEAMDRPVRKSKGPSGPNGSWSRYRAKFVTPDNVAKGVQFWRQYSGALDRAAAKYGVPPEVIVGIIGVETRWGRIMGNTRILDALATLAFAYPRRADYFTGELGAYLVMARDEGFDPARPTGSFAGAMGYGQFMPSSFHRYAVDFDGNGHRDLWNPVDAIGSVANYFRGQGWQPGQPVAVPATVSGTVPAGLATGYDSHHSLSSLAADGIVPTGSVGGAGSASLIRLDVGSGYQYWLGLKNFYVITRYNHSNYYAMAVYQLGRAVKAQVQGGRYADAASSMGEGDRG